MSQTNAVILCLAYIIGLLSTSVSWGGYGIITIGLLLSYLASKNYCRELLSKWRFKPSLFLVAGMVGFLATLYLQIKTPQPAVNDISQFVTNGKQVVTVRGEVSSLPRLTRSQKGQFWLKSKKLNQIGKTIKVTGNLYVTVPLLQSTALYPGQAIAQLREFCISRNLQLIQVGLTLNGFCSNKIPLLA